MYKFIYYSLLFVCFTGFSQEADVTVDTLAVDNNYREDQFYVSVTYNFINRKPDGVSQQGFSSGFHVGFIRDMPINEKRTLAFGIGLGLSINSYNQNLRVSEADNKQYSFDIIDDTNTSFTKNRYFTYLLEAPFEFRWRNSTPTSYKFWRIYSGFKIGYLFANKTKYIGEPNNVELTNIDAFNNFQYGLTLGAGYNTWNLHLYYALNPIFDNAKLENGDPINMNSIKIGLIFYIL